MGYVLGFMSTTLKGPRHILEWTSKFTRKMAKSSQGGEVYAFSEMVDHMLLLKDFCGPPEGANPGSAGLEDCESLFTHLNAKKMITKKNLVRHFFSSQQAPEGGDLDNVYRLPATDNPVGGLTKVWSDVATL